MKRPILKAPCGLAAMLLIATTLVPLGCGCTKGQGTLKIGCLVPLTGSMAGRFDDATYALKWLAEDINQSNHELSTTANINGKEVTGLKVKDKIYKIEVIEEDATSENIYSGMLKLYYEDQVVAAFGSTSSTGLFNVQPIVEGEGLVFINLAGSPTAGNMKYEDENGIFQFICTTLTEISLPATYDALFEGITGYDAPLSAAKLGVTGPVRVYVVDIDDFSGDERVAAGIEWAKNNSILITHVGDDQVPTGLGNWGSVVTAATSATVDADIIISGGMRQVDLVGFLKELRGTAGWDGPVVQTSGGAGWEELTDGIGSVNIAHLENFYQRYVPPTLNAAGDEFLEYLGTQEERPAYIDTLYEKANSSPAIASPVELVKYYGVALALLEAISTARVTTAERAHQIELAEALGDTTVWDLFQKLEWGGEESYGRKSSLWYTNHYGVFKTDGTMKWLLPLVYKAN